MMLLMTMTQVIKLMLLQRHCTQSIWWWSTNLSWMMVSSCECRQLRWSWICIRMSSANVVTWLRAQSTFKDLWMTCFTFTSHAEWQTFVVATELTPVTFALINHTAALFTTLVHELLANCSLEETFASFTADINTSTNTASSSDHSDLQGKCNSFE